MTVQEVANRFKATAEKSLAGYSLDYQDGYLDALSHVPHHTKLLDMEVVDSLECFLPDDYNSSYLLGFMEAIVDLRIELNGEDNELV